MVDPTLVALAGEGLKLGIQFLIAQARAQGMTDEQIDVALESERERFRRNVAEPLPDV